jgi:hypothetical protein
MRRWLVLAVGLTLTAVVGVAAISLVSTNHQASGEVLLLPPSEPVPDGGRFNPYLNLPSGVTFTASLIAGTVTSRDSQREMVDSGFTSTYSVAVVPGSGPLILITVEDTDPVAALATRDELIRRIGAELERIQEVEDVPTEQLVVSRNFGVSSKAEVLAGSRIRALAMVVALGTVLTAVAVFAVERRAVRRKAARQPTTDSDEPADLPKSRGPRRRGDDAEVRLPPLKTGVPRASEPQQRRERTLEPTDRGR